ncbi:MAG: hypothetical protein ACP5O2_10625 [Bacteroidales bacterium]
MELPRILLIDDDRSYCKRMVKEALTEGFVLIYEHSLDEGIKILEEREDIVGVILDSHCYVYENQKDPPGANFITHAIEQLSTLRESHNRHPVICVNTDNREEFEKQLTGYSPVFAKGETHPEIWKFLKENVQKLPSIIIKEDYPEIFDNIHLLYTEELEYELLDLIAYQRRGKHTDIPNRLSQVRRLLEWAIGKTYQELFKKDVQEILESGRAGFAAQSLSILNKADIVNRHMYKIIHLAYSFCSEYGNHAPLKQSPMPLNSITLNYLVGALLLSIDYFLRTLENKEQAFEKVIDYLNKELEKKQNH